MSKKLNYSFAIFIFLIGLFSANISQAQTNAYFDPNGTTTGEGGSGTWSTSNTNWTTNSVNATANSGGPIGGGLFALANTNAGVTNNGSGGYNINFGGTAGTVTQGGAYQAYGVNFLTTGYTWNIDGTGTNNRTITTTNGVSLGANALTLANGPRGLNSFTFSSANGITGSSGANLTLRNLVADSASNSFGVYLSGGTISSNIAINVDIGTGSKIFLGSQSSSGATIDSAITLNTNASGVALNITNSSTGIVSMNGVISGASGLVLNNTSSGKIALNGANTYAGGTTVGSTGTGDVRYNTNSAFGTGTVTISDGATSYLRANVSSLDVTNAVAIGTGSTLQLATVNSGHKTTWSGVISGAGGINYGYSDAGLYLTGTNSSFGGGVNVSSSGTLYVTKLGMAGANSSIGTNGTITISPSGTTAAGKVRWTGSADEISDKSFALTTASSSTNAGMQILVDGATNSTLTLNGNINSTGINNKIITLAGYNTNTLVMNGTINETSGYTNSLTVGGNSSGKIVLNGMNTFGGAVTITQNTGQQYTWLQTTNIGNSGAASALGRNGTINIGTTNDTAYAVLKYTGTGETSDKVINLGGTAGGATLDQSGTGNLKFSSAMTATGVGAKTITLTGSSAGTGELGGAISDLGGNVISLTKSGSGAWTLSGANTYSGLTTLKDGSLKIGLTNGLVNGVLAGASSSSLMGTLDLTAGGNYVMNSYGTSTTSGGFMNFTNSSGTASTLTFTNANNYISVGTAGGRTLTNASANLTIAFNGAVDIGSSTSNNVTFAGPGNFTLNGALNSTGTALRDLTKTGDGTLTLNAASGYNGVTTLNLGTIALGANGTLGTNSVIMGATSTLAVGTSSSTIKDLTVNNGTITGSGTLNSANNFTFNNTATSTVSANLAGTAALTQTGSGKVVLSGSNSFSGGLNLNSAANGLDVTRAEALGKGTITAGSTNSKLGLNTITSLTITNAVNTGSSNTATMVFNPGASGNSMTVTGLISGSGIAKVSGGGDLYLNNSGNTYAGGTEVGTGRIFVGSDGALGATTGAVNFGTMTSSLLAVTSDVSFNASRNFTMSAAGYTANIDTGANNVTINGVIAPISGVTGGVLAKLGTGALTLGGNNTYSGGTIVSAGTLIGTTASLQGAITNNAAVIFNQSSSGSYANVMSGTGSLSITNSGTVTLTRTNTYSGATTVSQGTLLVDSTGSIASSSLATVDGGLLNVNGTAGAVRVNNGGSLGGSGSVGALNLNSGGTLTPGNSPGTLTAASATILGGSTYNWQISALTGTAGTAWDLFSVTGLLDMTGVTDANKWNLVVTADAGFAGWSDTSSYSYVFAQAANVTGFDTTNGTDVTSLFNITASGFTSSSLPNSSFNPNGDFKVVVGNADGLTTLNLMAVPEPSTGSMLGLGFAGLFVARLLRRKTS